MDLNTRKLKIIHPPPNEESHPITYPLGKTVDKTGDSLSPNQNIIIINKIWQYFIRNGKRTMKLNQQKTKWT